ncbi:hypothetical protein L208DRAFT_1471778 [Tricholoma matsutake]|nr:hypothetical protein L208DRAFT_1471778 [Tricholoma matsutake 945]
MPLRVIQRVKRTWNEIGDVCRDRQHQGRAPLLSVQESQFMVALLEHTPDLYLDEIQEQLQEQHNVTVSLNTISRTLKRLGISSKKLSRAASEHCKEARNAFALKIGAYPVEYLVAGDEAAVNVLTTYKTNRWLVQGLQARKRCNFVCSTRYVHLTSERLHNKFTDCLLATRCFLLSQWMALSIAISRLVATMVINSWNGLKVSLGS